MKITIEEFQKTETYRSIMENAKKYRLISERRKHLKKCGFHVETKPMGSGGIGQVKKMSDHYRIQVGYGVSKHNYALCVIVPELYEVHS